MMTRWRDLAVGDVVRVRGNCEFPADIVMLQSSDPQGSGARGDGEFGRRDEPQGEDVRRRGLPFGGDPASPDELRRALRHTRVECEPPNNQLYTFEGKWVGLGSRKRDGTEAETNAKTDAETASDAPLRADNLLLRGSTLRNVDWILGVVVFTGADSKLMRNMTRAPHKVSRLERHMNVLVIFVGRFKSPSASRSPPRRRDGTRLTTALAVAPALRVAITGTCARLGRGRTSRVVSAPPPRSLFVSWCFSTR